MKFKHILRPLILLSPRERFAPSLIRNSNKIPLAMQGVWVLGDGERGIRTLDRVAPIQHFQCCAFDHSASSPPAFMGQMPM